MKGAYRYIVPAFILICVCAFTHRKTIEPRLKYLPSDMVLVIPGEKDSLKPFIVSNHLTTQKEYITYLLWVILNYRDNPVIVAGALPADTLQWSRLFDAANENLPVTGLSNIQIMNYCIWRTDKLNEYILIKEGIITEDNHDFEDHFFNLEAFTFGYYSTVYKEHVSPYKIKWSSKYEPDPPVSWLYADRYFFPNHRLPNADELSYISHTYSTLFLNEGNMNSCNSYYYNKLACKWGQQHRPAENTYDIAESYIRMFIGFDRKKYPIPPFNYQRHHNYYLNCSSPWGYYSERCLDIIPGKKSQWKNYSCFEGYDKPVNRELLIEKDSTGYLFQNDIMIMDEHKGDPVMVKYSSVLNALKKNMEYTPGGSVRDTSAVFRYNNPENQAGFRVVMFAPDAVLTMKKN